MNIGRERINQEIELKLQLLDENKADLWQLAFVQEGLVDEPEEQDLSSIYYDTQDHRLLQHGYSLRMREKEGTYTLTIKGTGEVSGGLHSRKEWNYPLSEGIPTLEVVEDLTLKNELESLIESETLTTLVETTFRRTRAEWRDTEGNLVEIALDEGIIRTIDKTTPISEVELELLKGHNKTLFTLGEAIAREIPMELGNDSKFLRGLLLLGLPIHRESEQVEQGEQGGKVKTPAKNEGLEEIIPEVLEASFKRVMAAWAQLQHQGPRIENVHKIRVECRQLRSLLRFFKPVIDSTAADSLCKTLRQIAKEFDGLRQLDVLELHFQQSSYPGACRNTGQLIRYKRSREGRKLENIIRTGKFTPLFLRAWKQVAQCKVKEKARKILVSEFAVERLDSWKQKREKKMRRVPAGNIEKLHRLRIKAKAARYVVQWLAPSLPDKHRKAGKAMKAQQNLLGQLHDTHQERNLLASWVRLGGLTAETMYQTGLYEGWLYRREEDLWNQVMSLIGGQVEGGEDIGPTESDKKN